MTAVLLVEKQLYRLQCAARAAADEKKRQP
jgi:hypothetical protein